MKLHYTHPDGRIIGDVMPLHDGHHYHLFYLVNGSGNHDIHHEHVISSDRLNWTLVKPSVYGAAHCAFTGSYWIDSEGIYRCFFTKWNPDDESGREHIAQASSPDGLVWTELDWQLDPDGFIYSTARYRDFRDPEIIYDANEHIYHMILLANPASTPNTKESWDEHWVLGHYCSTDLLNWTPLPPLTGKFADECPQWISDGTHHLMLGCHGYGSSSQRFGSYVPRGTVDPGCKAGKALDDGQERWWWGGFIQGPLSSPHRLKLNSVGLLEVSLDRQTNYPNLLKLTHYQLQSIDLVVHSTSYTVDLQCNQPVEIVIEELITGTTVLHHHLKSLSLYLILDQFLCEIDDGIGNVETTVLKTTTPHYRIQSNQILQMVVREY